MMKPQNFLFPFLGAIILALGIAFYIFLQRDQINPQVYPATAQRDCAPWDGSAFTVQIPWQDGTVIDISIWQSPEIDFPKTFSFPDNSGQVGNVILILPVGDPQSLSGTVSFSTVNMSAPVKGTFDLKDEAENFYTGMFQAAWQEMMVLCG